MANRFYKLAWQCDGLSAENKMHLFRFVMLKVPNGFLIESYRDIVPKQLVEENKEDNDVNSLAFALEWIEPRAFIE